MKKLLLSLILVTSKTGATSVFEAVSTGISGGDFKICRQERPADCLRIRAARLDQASIGNLWVGEKATVTLNSLGKEQRWNDTRVIIDIGQNQVVIENLQSRKLRETIISLKDFSIQRNEIKL